MALNRRQSRAGAKRGQQPAERLAAMLNEAVQQHQAGRRNAAEKLYRRVLKAVPDQPDALHWLGVLTHERGQHDKAATLIEKAIATNGRDPAYHYHLGEAYRAADRAADAAASYRRGLALAPDFADLHFALGNSLLDLGDPEKAAGAFRDALAAEPDDAEYLTCLGIALAELDQTDAAAEQFGAALKQRPDYADAHYHLGLVREKQGREDDAIACYQFALAGEPAHAPALTNLGRLLKQSGNLDGAIDCHREALRLRPESETAHLSLANALREARRYDETIDILKAALRLAPKSLQALNNLGLCLDEQGDHEGALDCYRAALEIDPDFAEGQFNIAVGLQNRGRFAEAIDWHRKALASRPDLAQAYYSLAANKEFKAEDADIAQIEDLLRQEDLSDEKKVHLNFALAQAYDDRDQVDRAFQHYRTANDLKSRLLGYDVEANERYTDRIIATFDRDFFAARQDYGSDSPLPIVIVGMPRSGTTLVEQILSSHPDVFGAGELRLFLDMVTDLPAMLETETDEPECIGQISREMSEDLAARHLKTLSALSPVAARVTDKMPSNYLRLGLIALLFPKAAIVHCNRDPLDNCVSCYLQNFGQGMNFTYDLRHLGLAHRAYQRLMAHWRAVLPVPVLDVDYEKLIADQESVSRQIVDFCGLDWDDTVLDFHRTEREIRTASFWQARQPIYKSSIGRWRRYRDHLGPLFDALGHSEPPVDR